MNLIYFSYTKKYYYALIFIYLLFSTVKSAKTILSLETIQKKVEWESAIV